MKQNDVKINLDSTSIKTQPIYIYIIFIHDKIELQAQLIQPMLSLYFEIVLRFSAAFYKRF